MSASAGDNKKASIAVIGGLVSGIAFVVFFGWAVSENSGSTAQTTASTPTNFAAAQEEMLQRGNTAMGFDQNKIMHHFMATPTGGQIMVVALDSKDNATISQIKSHVVDIEDEFSKGNFTKPFFIHDQQVPGTDVMGQKKDLIRYSINDLENGATLVLTTGDQELLQAIQQFMEFQSGEHMGH